MRDTLRLHRLIHEVIDDGFEQTLNGHGSSTPEDNPYMESTPSLKHEALLHLAYKLGALIAELERTQ